MIAKYLGHYLTAITAIALMASMAGTQVQARSEHAGLTKVTLQLKWVPQAQFAGYFVALDKGFYRKQGLDVTIKAGGPDIAPENVVASGGAQFGIDWLSALLAARDKGVPIENIAQIFQASGMRLISFKSEHITSPTQFKNKKVGVWFSGNEYQFMALMHKYHMDPPSKYMTVAKQPFVMDTFLNHSLDVAHAMTYNELGVVYEKGVKPSQLNVLDYNKLGVSILEDGIFANPSWANAHKSLVVKFLKGSIEGWAYAVKHPTEAGTISFSHSPSGTTTKAHQVYMAKEVAKLITYGPGASHPIGYMDPTAFQRTWTTLLQQKVINKAPKFAYNQQFWRAATNKM